MLKVSNFSLQIPSGENLFGPIGFTIGKGEVTVLQGPNGRGKTSFLRAIHGKWKFYDGELENTFRKTGFLPQEFASEFFIPMSLKDVISIVSKNSELQSDFSLFPDMNNRMWNHASGGEKMKTLLVAFIRMGAELLLLDEPFNHLDRKSANELWGFFEELKNKQVSVILVHHGQLPSFVKVIDLK